MFFVVLRLVLCRLGVGSGALLRGNSSSGMISLLRPWELDILFEMLVGKYNTADVVKNQNGITPKVFLRVQEEQGAFTVRFLMRT